LQTIGLGVQYFMNPKGVLFTGYLVSNESLICTILLGMIEFCFLWATWVHAVSVMLLQVLAYRELTVIFETLTEEVEDLNRLQEKTLNFNKKHSLQVKAVQKWRQYLKGHENGLKTDKQQQAIKPEGSSELELPGHSRYSIELIFTEYRKLQIVSDRLKHITSYVLLTTIMIYMWQISSDVFLAIRLAHEGDFSDIGFYVADCVVSM